MMLNLGWKITLGQTNRGMRFRVQYFRQTKYIRNLAPGHLAACSPQALTLSTFLAPSNGSKGPKLALQVSARNKRLDAEQATAIAGFLKRIGQEQQVADPADDLEIVALAASRRTDHCVGEALLRGQLPAGVLLFIAQKQRKGCYRPGMARMRYGPAPSLSDLHMTIYRIHDK